MESEALLYMPRGKKIDCRPHAPNGKGNGRVYCDLNFRFPNHPTAARRAGVGVWGKNKTKALRRLRKNNHKNHTKNNQTGSNTENKQLPAVKFQPQKKIYGFGSGQARKPRLFFSMLFSFVRFALPGAFARFFGCLAFGFGCLARSPQRTR